MRANPNCPERPQDESARPYPRILGHRGVDRALLHQGEQIVRYVGQLKDENVGRLPDTVHDKDISTLQISSSGGEINADQTLCPQRVQKI